MIVSVGGDWCKQGGGSPMALSDGEGLGLLALHVTMPMGSLLYPTRWGRLLLYLEYLCQDCWAIPSINWLLRTCICTRGDLRRTPRV